LFEEETGEGFADGHDGLSCDGRGNPLLSYAGA
jgi:hypothetical protein